MKKFLLGLLASTMAITMSAQTQPTQPNLGKSMYKGKLGLSHVRNLSDQQLSEVGRHVSAIPMPTKAQTAQMLRKAMANRPSMAKGKQANIGTNLCGANYTENDIVYAESWESWYTNAQTGENKGFFWIPSAWTSFINFDKETYISETTFDCPTWMCYEADGYNQPYATDGRAVLLCLYGNDILGADGKTVIAPAPEQDEWMVSPAIKGVQGSNFLIFDLAYCPIYSHLFVDGENVSVDMNKLAYDVEVLITTSTRSATNNESNYTKVFNLAEIVDEMMTSADFTDTTTIANLMNMRWQHFRIPLTEYDGKDIRVAFRYKGKLGGAVMLDAIRVSDMLPVALFDRPEGSFFMGFSDDARLSYSHNVLMPAYIPTTWTNYSNADAESFTWTYKQGETETQSSERDLQMPAVAPGQLVWPSLQAVSGARSDVYSGGADVNVTNVGIVHSDNGAAKVGGDARISYPDGTTVNFTLGNFDPTKQYWLGEISNSNGVYAFGTGSGAFWAGMTNYKYNAVSGIANVYDAPASPYVFNNVSLPLGNFFNLGSELVCTVYKAKDLGNGALEVLDEILGQATTTEAKNISGGYILSFDFNNIMVIDSPIAIEISGIDNDNVISFAPLSQAQNHDNGKGYAFVLLKNQETKGVWWCEIAGALSSVEGTGNMLISHCIGMNAIFPYIHSNNGDVFEALAVGEKRSFDIDSYWYPKKLDANDQLNGWTIECSEPWVKVEPTLNDAEKKAGVDITVEQLPSDIKGRKAEVTIKGLGCEETITVVQGEASGIEGITVDGVTASKGTYSIAGQRINRNNAKNGLYIENRGGKFVKVIK